VVRAGGWSVGGRVCGILAVSRAFGDYEFKGGRFDLLEDLSEEPLAKKATLESPPVIPTPDVLEIAREVDKDEWLVIASDGLWVGRERASVEERRNLPLLEHDPHTYCVEFTITSRDDHKKI
jgi:serine/threonine protein phosphatase PrpC